MIKIRIFLDKKIVSDLTISDKEIGIYCALRSLMKKEQDSYGITTNHLLYYVTGKNTFSKFDRQSFCTSFKKLVEREIISIDFSFGANDKIVNLSQLHISKENNKLFISVEISEIQSILNGCGANKFSVLRYYILLIGTFNPQIEVGLIDGKVKSNILGNMPIDYLKKITGLSKSTIISYNKQLESLTLIYMYHAKDYYRISKTTIKSPPNVYSRYTDKEFVDQFVKNKCKDKKYILSKDPKEAANHKRRLAQRYNKIISGSHPYTKEEVQEVYDYILAANQKYLSDYEKSKWEPYKEKIRDVSKLESILQKGADNT